MFAGEAPLSGEQIKQLDDAYSLLLGIPGVSSQVSPLIPSEDGKALEAFVPIDTSADIGEVVEEISGTLAEAVPEGIQSFVTGPAGFAADLGEAFSGIDGLLLMVALAAVFVILIVVYRSFLLPIAVLSTSLFALTVALLSVWWLAKWDILLLSGQTQGILFILVIGAATDYSLLYVARYREELRIQRDKWVATLNALKASVEPIVASGSTVIAGLLCLLFSDLKSNSTLGPVAAIGIVFAMLAALTLLPAILFAFGRVAFRPKRPKYEPEVVAQEDGMPSSGVWTKVGALVQKYPRRIWVGTLIVLMLGVVAVPQLKADGVAQSELVLGTSAARDGQEALGEHFPGGSGSPVYVVADQDDVSHVMEVLEGNEFLEGGEASKSIVDGQVLVQATLTVAQDSEVAQGAVRGLRADLAEQGIDAQVGGVTATAIDTNDASTHDRNLIIPVVLIVILLILMALLRSIVAPVLLILSTVVSFGTAMGVSALVFNHLFDFPGADPAVPLFGFVFLVALGIDYNIFLATRIREESKAHGTREGIIRGLVATGGVITSAGLVLAATFAALSVIPILFLAQLAFIVAFGVLLATFLVRAFLVPALFYDIGKKIWWPSKVG